MIYLDNNASTKVDPEVRAAVERALGLDGNPSSIHSAGRRARRAVEEARDEVARLVGASPEEIFFSSGGTEANAMAIFGAARADAPARAPSRKIVRTGAEHPSVREAFERLASAAYGLEEAVVNPGPSGALDPEAVAAELSGGARLLSVMLANNEYGGLFPVAGLAQRARAAGAVFHTDAVQAAGRIPIEVRALGVDLLSLSAHKMHGPKGIGALYVRKGLRLSPRTPGGGQERRQRAGTENVPGIAGFGVAARLARERLAGDAAGVARLRDRLETQILAAAPGARVVGGAIPRLPNTAAILFPGVSGEALAIRLDLAGVAVSVGSACSSGTTAPSPALLSLGLSRAEARSVVRFSLSRFTTAAEVEAAARAAAGAAGAMGEAATAPALSTN
ncbi:MAG TPA: cysteine desulfurase family protein [Thermoanaerobaculia bacterium]